jgi:aspartyl-tRNA(Asn)/glutamyl-tRNA(Gln) amidotransferase subunit C
MTIDQETIEYIAKLAKLKFSPEEIKEFSQEFEMVLDHFKNIENEDLSQYDVYAVEESKSVLREDQVKPFDQSTDLFKNTLEIQNDYIIIPKIVE